MNQKKFVVISAIPILVLLLLGVGVGGKTANAWDGGGGCNWKIGPDSYDNGLSAGEQEAIYDHENQISYNPFPQSCQSDVYQHAFHEGRGASSGGKGGIGILGSANGQNGDGTNNGANGGGKLFE